jgi:hypothetical protein
VGGCCYCCSPQAGILRGLNLRSGQFLLSLCSSFSDVCIIFCACV